METRCLKSNLLRMALQGVWTCTQAPKDTFHGSGAGCPSPAWPTDRIASRTPIGQAIFHPGGLGALASPSVSAKSRRVGAQACASDGCNSIALARSGLYRSCDVSSSTSVPLANRCRRIRQGCPTSKPETWRAERLHRIVSECCPGCPRGNNTSAALRRNGRQNGIDW